MVAIEAEVSGLKVICSKNVPEEVNLTGNVKFINLRDKEKWIDESLKMDMRKKIDIGNIFKEYDIKFKSKELERKYCKIIKGL